MRKTKRQKVLQSQTVIVDIFCNQCGGSCKSEEKNFQDVFHGLVETEVSGGYSSPVLTDLMQYRFSLCEGCLRKLFNGFKLPVEVKDEITPDFIPETQLAAHQKRHERALARLTRDYKRQGKPKSARSA